MRPTSENAPRVWRALETFGAPLEDLTRADLTSTDLVFQIGLPPRRMDIPTNIGSIAWTRLHSASSPSSAAP